MSLLLILMLCLPGEGPAQPGSAFVKFQNTRKPESRKRQLNKILKETPDFDTLYQWLQQGKSYSAKVKKGKFYQTHSAAGFRFHYTVLVPEDYDPNRAYPLHVFLHGGVGRPEYKRDGSWWRDYESVKSSERISVFPASWNASMWWEGSQSSNLEIILRELQHTYNIDENRVHLIGISDGGTGTYFQAFRNTTPWASFMPLIGSPLVLSNPTLRVDGEIFPTNIINKPVFVVNGEIDHLYPVSSVEPMINLFRQAGARITFKPQAGVGHNLNWLPQETENIKTFLKNQTRTPLPDALSWHTETTEKYNRAHWLIIEKLGEVAGETDMIDFNLSRNGNIFPRAKPSGRVVLLRKDNTIHVHTKGVRQFRLLLSPQQFDLSQTIKVITNKQTSFEGILKKDPKVLLEWASQDNDRTMLFAAELVITL